MEETDIREIALDNPDISQKVEEILEQIDEQEEKVEEKVVEKVEKVEKAEAAREEEPINSLPEEVPAKKVARPKGRPKGALNKAPAKPRAKKKMVPKEESVEEEERGGVEFEAPWEETLDRRRRISDSDLATMLEPIVNASCMLHGSSKEKTMSSKRCQ